MKSITLLRSVGVAAGLAVIGSSLPAATSSVFTTGLRAPTKITHSTKGSLLVAESGNGPNTGRISILDADTGARRTLLDGLPSGASIPANEPSGPSGLAMEGRTLYVVIGLGDAVIGGPAPGTQVPNPTPSSPLFSSVLAVHLSANTEKTTEGFTLTRADHDTLKNGGTLRLDHGHGDKLTVELVADIPDYKPEPTPAVPTNVRQSNPFGIVKVANALYVNDASGNNVLKIDLTTGASSTFATFAPLPNNRGFGPPVVEAVPDSIRVYSSKQALVTLLSGFPFPIGNAQARILDLSTGTHEPLIVGLTSAIDILPVGDGFLTLEFSADQLNPAALGRIRSFAGADAAPVTVMADLITPTSMARDSSGVIFVTEISQGRVVKVAP